MDWTILFTWVNISLLVLIMGALGLGIKALKKYVNAPKSQGEKE